MPHKLTYLIIHCTATPEGRAVFPSDIRDWHTKPVSQGGRGWKQVGYSDMILLDGSLQNLVQYNNDDVVDPWEITNGVAGVNSISRHVVYVGGMDKANKKPKDTRTKKQIETLRQYVLNIIAQYPSIKVAGHNQFAAKACPSFDVPAWLRKIGVQPKNIKL